VAAGTAKAGRLLQVMFGKHVIRWPSGCLITGLYRDRGWSAVIRSSSGCRSEPDIDHESDQVP